VRGDWFTPQHGDSGLAHHPHRVELRGGLGGLVLPDQCPACGAPASALAMVSETRRYRVRPQTPISAAFDFSDELGTVIEGRRRVYSVQDPGFAERFGAANQDRARRTSAVVGGVLIAALLLWRLLAG
jgi:hypothetical protein